MADTVNDNIDEIIRGCLRKDLKSQEMLYKRYFGYALKVALVHNSNRDIAMEIVNDSFVKIFSHIGRYESSLPFTNWISRIVVNTSIDWFRKNKRNYQADEEEAFLVPDNAPGIVTQMTAQDILKMMNLLPEIQRMVFSLYEIEGYNHDEISSLLKIPESTSRVYLARSKKRLRELFRMYFNKNYERVGN